MDVVTAALEPEGFETLQAVDGQEALGKLSSRNDIVLVMSDVNMPRMNGLDLVANARELGIDVPFVMLTTEADPGLMERAKAMGVKGWMLKPVKPHVLVSAVKALTATAPRSARRPT